MLEIGGRHSNRFTITNSPGRNFNLNGTITIGMAASSAAALGYCRVDRRQIKGIRRYTAALHNLQLTLGIGVAILFGA